MSQFFCSVVYYYFNIVSKDAYSDLHILILTLWFPVSSFFFFVCHIIPVLNFVCNTQYWKCKRTISFLILWKWKLFCYCQELFLQTVFNYCLYTGGRKSFHHFPSDNSCKWYGIWDSIVWKMQPSKESSCCSWWLLDEVIIERRAGIHNMCTFTPCVGSVTCPA